jgi:hypothetical protein
MYTDMGKSKTLHVRRDIGKEQRTTVELENARLLDGLTGTYEDRANLGKAT